MLDRPNGSEVAANKEKKSRLLAQFGGFLRIL
jgi:hypothetical protein